MKVAGIAVAAGNIFHGPFGHRQTFAVGRNHGNDAVAVAEKHTVQHFAAVVERNGIGDLAQHPLEVSAFESDGTHRHQFAAAGEIFRRNAQKFEAAGTADDFGVMPFIAGDDDLGIFKLVDQRQQPFGRHGGGTGNFHFGFDPGNDPDLEVSGGQRHGVVRRFDQYIAENGQCIAAADGVVYFLKGFEKFFSAYRKFHLFTCFRIPP